MKEEERKKKKPNKRETNKWCKDNHSPPPTSRPPRPSQSLSNGYLGSTPCPACIQFYCWAWCHTAWEIPLVSWGELSQLWLLPSLSPPTPGYSLRGQSEKQRKHWCCAGTVQQYLKHWCVISTVLVTNLKPSNIWAAMKEINFTPARSCTRFYTNIFKRYFRFSCSWGVKMGNIIPLAMFVL